MLQSHPSRNPSLRWEASSNGDVTITMTRRVGWGISLLSKLFYLPREKTIVLDELGSRVWLMCDGKQSVSQMIAHLSSAYKLNRKEAEVSLLHYLRTLGKKRIVGFILKKESAAKRPGSGKRWVKQK